MAKFERFEDIEAWKLRSQLYVALDQRYIRQEDFEQARDKLTRIGQMTCGLMDDLKNSEYREKNRK
jgi:hypothetical protein